ncbi:hypothetical protein KFL_017410010, partial [Klebsormidium nitens]
FAPRNTNPFDQFNLFPSPKDRMISLSVNRKTQRAYFVTDAQSNSLALYPSTYRVSYISAFKGKNFTEISDTPGKVGSIQGPMWFSATVDLGFAWHDSLASPSGLDLVAFNPATCPGGYLTCQYLSTLCSCRLNNTSTSPLISLTPQIGLTPCFGSSQTPSNISQDFPTCLVPGSPPLGKSSPPPAKPPPSKISPPSVLPPQQIRPRCLSPHQTSFPPASATPPNNVPPPEAASPPRRQTSPFNRRPNFAPPLPTSFPPAVRQLRRSSAAP